MPTIRNDTRCVKQNPIKVSTIINREIELFFSSNVIVDFGKTFVFAINIFGLFVQNNVVIIIFCLFLYNNFLFDNIFVINTLLNIYAKYLKQYRYIKIIFSISKMANSKTPSLQWNTNKNINQSSTINTLNSTFNKYHTPNYNNNNNNNSALSSKPINNGICSNCGKYGHFSYQCNHPTVSYGMIVYRQKNNKDTASKDTVSKGTAFKGTVSKPEYLMICRKDSFGYVDFIRGKYSLSDIDHIYHIFREMSKSEHAKIIQAESFNELWCDLWNIPYIKTSHKHEERVSRKKYEILKAGYVSMYTSPNILTDTNKSTITLETIIKDSSVFKDAEWEFPKGRKEFNESEINCALREFEEETGISQSNIQLVENLVGFDENYVGSNYAAYKHRYFLAEYTNLTNDNILDTFQKNEVGKLEWKSLDQCLDDMRPYHLEKKHILQILMILLTSIL